MKQKARSIRAAIDVTLHLFLILIGVMLLTNQASAENGSSSATIMVSCSIPAVPGINVPLIEEKISNIEAGTSAAEQEKAENPAGEPQEEIKNESPAMIQTDSENKILLAEGKNLPLTIQTLYSR